MDMVNVLLNNLEVFDKSVQGGLRDGGDLTMITLDDGTEGHRPAVCLTFTVQLPDGTLSRAQIVVTGRNFAMMAAAFRGRYGLEGDSVQTADRVN